MENSVFSSEGLVARSPLTGEIISHLVPTSADEASKIITRAEAAYKTWRNVLAPRRGEFVRLIGEELRAAKDDLGRLVTCEAGKILSEGRGEVQR